MNSIYGKICVVTIFCCFSAATTAQQVRILSTPNQEVKIPAGISGGTVDSLISTSEILLTEYVRAARLVDETRNRVTSESIARFLSLFNSNTLVVKDYVEYIPEEPVKIKDYASGVFNRLENKGVQMKLNKVELVEIKDDPSGFFVVVLAVEKSIYNYIDQKQIVKIVPSGRIFSQEFRIDVLKTDLGFAKIQTIKRICRDTKECPGEPDEFVHYFGPSTTLSKPLLFPTMSGWWATNQRQATVEVTGVFGIAAGFELFSNQLAAKNSDRKNFFLSCGVFYNYRRLESDFKNLNVSDFQAVTNSGSMGYLRRVTAVSVEEEFTLGTIEVPLGLGIRLKESRKLDLFVNARIIPGLTIASRLGFRGYGTYDAVLEEAMWRALEPGASDRDQWMNPDAFGPFDIGEVQELSGSPSVSTAGISLSTQLSPAVYLHLSDRNPRWSLLLALDFTYHMGSWLEHMEENNDIFTYSDDYPISALQHYTTAMRGFSTGLRVGLHRSISIKP